MKAKLWLFTMIIAVILSGCMGRGAQTKTTPSAPSAVTWPTKGWQTSTPAEQGMDPVLLDQMQTVIRDQRIGLHSLLIVRNGVIVSETYYSGNDQGTKHFLYSVTKSFVSTLMGIAIDQGKVPGVERPALEILAEREFQNTDARKEAMTIENLLTMSSGLDWVEADASYNKMYMSSDWVQMVMDLPMATDPGKEFLYCSGCSHILAAIVQDATGEPLLDFAKKNLFQPLGITDLRWETDRQGMPIGGWGLNLTARDMAKLGYLYLHHGAWEGKQVVSGRWVDAATARHIGTDGRLGYGYQWWTYPTHGAYAALGRYGQTIFVSPELDLVVVTTAQIESGHDPIFDLIDRYILPAVK